MTTFTPAGRWRRAEAVRSTAWDYGAGRMAEREIISGCSTRALAEAELAALTDHAEAGWVTVTWPLGSPARVIVTARWAGDSETCSGAGDLARREVGWESMAPDRAEEVADEWVARMVGAPDDWAAARSEPCIAERIASWLASAAAGGPAAHEPTEQVAP